MGTNVWTIEKKKHWWSRWKVIDTNKDIEVAYIRYFKIAYNIDIDYYKVFPHNRDKNKKVTYVLTFHYDSHPVPPEYTHTVGYKPRNYVRYYHACYSSESFEQALTKLWGDMQSQRTN